MVNDRAWVLLAGVALISSCTFRSDLPETTVISCHDNSECPSPLRCSVRVQRCVRENGDSEAPLLAQSQVTPSVAKRGDVITVTLTTTEPLFEAPTLSLEGAVMTARTPAAPGEQFTFTWAVAADAVEGQVELTADVTDLAGNEALRSVGSLKLDFTPPEMIAGSFDVQPALARPGERVLVQLAFSETLSGIPLIHLGAGPAILPIRSAGVLSVFQLTVPADAPDGELELSLDPIADLAGNPASPGRVGSLRVDTLAPRITRVETLNGITVRSAVSGFNTFTVVAEADSGSGDSLRAVDVRFLGAPLTCRAPSAGRRECDVTVDASMPEGENTIQVLATDAVGNTAVATLGLRLDFTAPHVAEGTFQTTLFAGNPAVLSAVSLLGPMARAVVTFSTTEPPGPAPSLNVGGQAFTCTHTGSAFSCTYTHVCASLTDGSHALSLTIADDVGNAFTGSPQTGALLTTDCLAPLPPKVDVAGKVVWHRAPFGTDWSVGSVGSRIELAADAIDEANALVRIVTDLGSGRLAVLGVGPAGIAVGATTIQLNDLVDRVKVSVQAVDAAGNASPPVLVRENVASLLFLGPDVTSATPGLFQGTLRPAMPMDAPVPWPGGTQTLTTIATRLADQPTPRYGGLLVSLGNDRLLMTGGQTQQGDNFEDAWLFDAKTLEWTPYPNVGAHPVARFSGRTARLGDGRVLLFGGQLPSTQLLNDGWLFNPDTGVWRQLTGRQPSARVAPITTLHDGRALMFGGYQASTTVLRDTWVFDPATERWTELATAQTGPNAPYPTTFETLAGGSVLAFGGTVNSAPSAETWLFDPSATRWIQISGTHPPSTLYDHVLLDDGRVMVSGVNQGAFESWLFDGATRQWSQIVGPQPTPRQGARFVAAPGKVFMIGGSLVNSTVPDMWSLDLSTRVWTQVASTSPFYRGADMMQISPNRAVQWGSYRDSNDDSAETWIFDAASQAWTVATSARPPHRIDSVMVTMGNGKFLFRGGSEPAQGIVQNDNFVADPYGAIVETTGPHPQDRSGYVARAIAGGNVCLVGGPTTADPDSWLFSESSSTWSTLSGPQPPTRYNAMSTTLTTGDLLVVAGDGLTDVWLLNHVTHAWSQLPSLPTQRARGQLVPLPQGRVMIVGGEVNAGSGILATTQLLLDSAHSAWTVLTGPQPAPRLDHQAVALSNGDALLFGGSGSLGPLNDTWVFNSVTEVWRQVTTTDKPSPRLGFELRALPGNKAILLGGYDGVLALLWEMWIFDAVRGTWSHTQAGSHIPLPRFGPAFQANASGQMAFYGGYGDSQFLPDNALFDFWFFDLFGESATVAGTVPLSQLGITSDLVTSIAARATAGAEGFSLDGGSAQNGVELQIYRAESTGPLFHTCASSTAGSADAGGLECPPMPFAGATQVGLRVKPTGFSNGNPVGLTVNSAELSVYYRAVP